MNKKTHNILIAGVGGQGVLLASEIIAQAALLEGHDVKKSEVHGMAQRGGSVSSHVRFGPKIFSPIIPRGKVHFLLALEMLEGIRLANWLEDRAVLILNHQKIIPASTYTLGIPYPQDLNKISKDNNIKLLDIDAQTTAKELGNIRLTNVILLGVLSQFLDLSLDSWYHAIHDCVKPKYHDINKLAFERGIQLHKNSL